MISNERVRYEWCTEDTLIRVSILLPFLHCVTDPWDKNVYSLLYDFHFTASRFNAENFTASNEWWINAANAISADRSATKNNSALCTAQLFLFVILGNLSANDRLASAPIRRGAYNFNLYGSFLFFQLRRLKRHRAFWQIFRLPFRGLPLGNGRPRP